VLIKSLLGTEKLVTYNGASIEVNVALTAVPAVKFSQTVKEIVAILVLGYKDTPICSLLAKCRPVDPLLRALVVGRL
jgi:hypothetical protein